MIRYVTTADIFKCVKRFLQYEYGWLHIRIDSENVTTIILYPTMIFYFRRIIFHERSPYVNFFFNLIHEWLDIYHAYIEYRIKMIERIILVNIRRRCPHMIYKNISNDHRYYDTNHKDFSAVAWHEIHLFDYDDDIFTILTTTWFYSCYLLNEISNSNWHTFILIWWKISR